jgi:hypothetical protein
MSTENSRQSYNTVMGTDLAVFSYVHVFLKALTVLRGHLAYTNGLLDLHIETFW